MSFDLSWYGVPVEEEAKEEEAIVYGIPNNPELEQIIPAKFHSFVNEVIGDYNTLSDEEFWNVKEYEEDNKAKNMLGTIIVFLLVEKEYILQLDYKEDLVDYIEDIDNYWGTMTSTR